MANTILVTKQEKQILDRFNSGEWVYVGVGNHFWCSKEVKGGIKEAMTEEEKTALFSLENKGLVKMETKTITI